MIGFEATLWQAADKRRNNTDTIDATGPLGLNSDPSLPQRQLWSSASPVGLVVDGTTACRVNSTVARSLSAP
jgi:hypothetical protein